MAQSGADTNLLFGILAHQMDFIDRDQLVSAMNAWVLEKTTSLGRILIAQGALNEDTHALLEALMAKHLEMHGNDVEKSLAAVSSVASVADDLRAISDEDLSHSIAQMTVSQVSSDPYQTMTYSLGAGSSTGTRFRILRPHAKGGLGQVSVAIDEELHREVALKEIQPKHADIPESRARFVLEGEITGGLEHPGIVPVYGLGQYDDGRPFYAMRFVRGDSLEEAIRAFHKNKLTQSEGERQLQLRKLLGRLIDVCYAMHYAHSRGVLHRDLKPGNIMLGRYGETLVVDWGLAKPGHQSHEPSLSEEPALYPSSFSGSTATQMGSAMGTPPYMSPEQAAGRIDQLGPESDVYSLGATLYALLIGEAPYKDRDVGSILRKVQKGDFTPPRKTDAEIPAALNAICLKAMALEPEDRYRTPAAFADDMERWLADEPVMAYEEPWPDRARRWLRHHRTLTSSVATAVFAALVVLSIALVLISAAHRQAEENFQLARSSVDRFFTTVSEDTLLNQPGMQTLRKELLTDALSFYQEFLQQPQRAGELTEETAMTAFRVGRIKEELGERNEAIEHYQTARKIQQMLADKSGTDVAAQEALATTINAMGRTQELQGNWDAALKEYEAAAAARKKLADLDQTNRDYQRLWANSVMNVGLIWKNRGDLPKAEPPQTQAETIRDKAWQPGGHADLRRDMAKGTYNIANLLLDEAAADEKSAQWDAIERRLNDAITIFNEKASEPSSLESRYYRAMCYRLLGDAYLRQGKSAAAIEALEKARGEFDSLAWDNPAVPSYRHLLAGVLYNLGVQHRERHELDIALDYFEEAYYVLRPMVMSTHVRNEYRHDFALVLREQGRIHWVYGELDLAERDLTAALDIQLKLMRGDVNVPKYQLILDETNELLEKVAEDRKEADKKTENNEADKVENEDADEAESKEIDEAKAE